MDLETTMKMNKSKSYAAVQINLSTEMWSEKKQAAEENSMKTCT